MLSTVAPWSLSNPRPNKDVESRIFWNSRDLVPAVRTARGVIEKGGDERHDALREAVVTDVKRSMGEFTTQSGQVVHKASTHSTGT